MGMTGSSLQFVLLNSTTIENLSRKNFVWTLAIYMPRPPEVSPGFRTITFSNAQDQNRPAGMRTFAILHTKPGENPFDLGPFRNFKSVMGDYWYDWFFPFRYSPCCDHDRKEGQFAMGQVVQRMRKEAGISPPAQTDDEKPHTRHRRRRRRRRQHHGHHSEPGYSRTEKAHTPNDQGLDTGHDRDEIDLERGLRYTSRSVH